MEGTRDFWRKQEKIKEESKLLENFELNLPHLGLLVKWIETRVILFVDHTSLIHARKLY